MLYKKSEHDQLEAKMEELQWRTVTRVKDEWNLPFRNRENVGTVPLPKMARC